MKINSTIDEEQFVSKTVEVIEKSNNLKEVMEAWSNACQTNREILLLVHRSTKETMVNIATGKDPRFSVKDLYQYFDDSKLSL